MSNTNKNTIEKIWKFLDRKRSSINSYGRENIYFIIASSYFDDETISEYENIKNNESLLLILSRINHDYSTLIKEIRENFSKTDLKFVLSDNYLLKKILINQKFDLFLDDNLIKLLVSLLDIRSDDIILNPFSSYGEIMDLILKHNKNVIVNGLEIDSHKRNIATIKNSLISENFKILPKNLENTESFYKETNKLVSFPIINHRAMHRDMVEKSQELKNWIEENSIRTYGDLIYIIKDLLMSKNLERAIYIYPTGKLFNHREKDIMQFLVNRNLIEGIIQLPERIVYGTAIGFSIIVISRENETIKFVDARNEFKKDKFDNILTDTNVEKILNEYEKPNEIAKEVPIKDIVANNYVMLPSRLIVPDNQKIDDYYLLSDIADIQRGIGTIRKRELEKRISEKNTRIKYMQANDFSDDIDYSDLKSLDEVKKNESRYLAKDGDIVISKIQNFNSMIFENTEDYKIIVSGNLYKIGIKSDSKINPYYVQAYLETDHAKDQISRLVSGTSTLIMPVSTLEELKIPKLGKEMEETIANNYKNILRRMRIVKQQIKSLEEDKNIIFDGVI